MNDLIAQIHAAQRDAGERVVIASLEASGLRVQPERSVADIPDAELVRRVVQTLVQPRPRRAEFAWAEVHRAFGLGSTYAAQLCRRFGFDPDTGEPLKTPNVELTGRP